MVHRKTANQRDGYRVAWEIFRNEVESNGAARDSIVAEHTYITLVNCDIGPSNALAFVLAGISLEIRI